MHAHTEAFLDLALSQDILKLGNFTLKSGRQSPYFFNLGAIASGVAFNQLCDLYAQALKQSGISFDMLFGPAYKGIPLVTGVAIHLAQQGCDVPFAYNRKEAKDHGEGGTLVGAKPQGRVVIVDDVMTAGTAVRESIQLLSKTGAQPHALLIALDRQERGSSGLSAVQEMQQSGLQVVSLATLSDVIAYLTPRAQYADSLAAMRIYREQYAVVV